MKRSRKPSGILTEPLLRLALVIAAGFPLGCGVRGRPQPPLTPAEIGRGQPTFKRSSGEDSFQNVPAPDSEASPEPTPISGRHWNPPGESN